MISESDSNIHYGEFHSISIEKKFFSTFDDFNSTNKPFYSICGNEFEECMIVDETFINKQMILRNGKRVDLDYWIGLVNYAFCL